MIRTDPSWREAMSEATTTVGINKELGYALHVANLLSWRNHDHTVSWSKHLLRFAPHAAKYGAPVGAPVHEAMAQVLTNADESATTSGQHAAVQRLLFIITGWKAELSSPDDGSCDNCGTDLYHPETDLYVNTDGDAFCRDCYVGFTNNK